jgi:hypothetical protein
MPSAEASLYALLTSGSPNPVAALIGTRCYPLVLPQGLQAWPAIRYQRISTPRSQYRTLDGRADYASPRMQVDCYATTHASALAVAQAVYQMLEGFGGTVVAGLRIEAISTDDEGADLEEGVGPGGAPLYRQRLDLIMFHPEV